MAMRKRLGMLAGILLTAILSLAGTGQVLAAQPSEQQVRRLMDVIGLGKSLTQMNTQIATSMQQALPCVSANYWQNYMDDKSSNEFMGRLVPAFQKHFTADEIDGMVKFYGSPLGQKVLTEMPAALSEANQAGQQWSTEHRQQMIAKLEQAGTLGANGRCPASAFAGATDTDKPAEADSSADDIGANVEVTKHPHHVTSRHGHSSAAAKKHAGTTKKKAAPAKKGATKAPASTKKKPAPAKTSAKHTTKTKKPASTANKTQ